MSEGDQCDFSEDRYSSYLTGSDEPKNSPRKNPNCIYFNLNRRSIKMSSNIIISKRLISTASVVLIAALALNCNQLVWCQFLQPQSHLGRLVQSITSPLVGYPSSDQSGDSYDSDSPLSGSPGAGQLSADNTNSLASDQQQNLHNHYQSYERQQPQRAQHHRHQQLHHQQQQAMQQAPSQQRGVPQHYYGGGADSASNQDEDAGAPSNPRQQQAQEYQMGAYLGPTIDDKEINGAFNSNNDDDDSYDEGGRQRAATGSSGYASDAGASPSLGPFYGPSESSGAMGAGYGSPGSSARQQESSYRPGGRDENSAAAYGPLSDDDESGADEDEPPRGARPARGGQRGRHSSGLNQAASHLYNQQRQQRRPDRPRQSQPMMAAANGYAPYGYSGPIDLNGIMAAAQGDPNAGYQVYQGDGSYPGQSGYYQGGPQRQAAGSMNNPYGYNNNNNYGPPGGQQNQQGDNEDQDIDNDDD